MSEDGYLPPGVTHQMVEDSFGGPEDEDEGFDISLSDGRYIVVRLDGQGLVIEILDAVADGVDQVVDELEFNLAEASRLAGAINARLREGADDGRLHFTTSQQGSWPCHN